MEIKLRKKEEILKSYNGKVKEALMNIEENLLNDLLSTNLLNGLSRFDECQSTIEQIYFLYLKSFGMGSSSVNLEVVPQYQINAINNNYKVDFYITLTENFIVENETETESKYFDRTTSLCVECDDNEFYQKSQEQVEKEAERERDIVFKGFQLIRFTNSEIYNNPKKCAIETIRIMENELRKKNFKISYL